MSDYSIAIKIGGQIESSFNSSMQIAMNGLSALGAASVAGMAAAGRGIAAIGKNSVQVGKDFETAMSSASATAGASAEDFEKMKQAAMEMGRSTSKTASESAAALEYMALAGWDADTSISALPSILKASEATGMELGRTSDLVTDSMAALGVTVDQLPNYLDVATKAQNKSNQSAEQLMEAYLGVGGTMKNLNVPIAESATALGVLANRGIKGAEGGNALNAIMVNLTTGTGQAGQMMQKLGVSAFDSQGNFIGLENTLRQVNAAMAGCSEEERNAALAAIGGKQHVDALNSLMAGLNTTNEQGVSEWAALTAELQNCNGALDAMRDTKLDNLDGDLATLQSAAEDAGIKIYEQLNEPLRGLAQYGTQAIYTISDALHSGGLSGAAEAVGGVLADVLVNLAAQSPQFLDAAAGMVMAFISGIESNSGDIAQSFAELIAVGVDAVFQIIPQLFLAGVNLIAALALGIANQLTGIMETGVQAVTGFVQGISEQIPMIMSAALALMQALLSGIADNAPVIINAAIQLVGDLLIGIIQALPQVLQMGMLFIMELTNGIMASLPFLLQTLTQVVVYGVSTLGQMLPQFIDMGIAVIMNLLQGIVANLGNIAQAAVQIAVALFTGLVQAIPHIVTAVPRLTDAIVDTLADADWVGIGLQIIHAVVTGLIHGVGALLSAIPAIAKALGEVILKSNPIYIGFRFIKAVITGIINGIFSLGGLIWDAFKSLLFGGGKDTGAEETGASMAQDYATGADSGTPAPTALPGDESAAQAGAVQASSASDNAADAAAVAETASGEAAAGTEQEPSGLPPEAQVPVEDTAVMENGIPATAGAAPPIKEVATPEIAEQEFQPAGVAAEPSGVENVPVEAAQALPADSGAPPADVIPETTAIPPENAAEVAVEQAQVSADVPTDAIQTPPDAAAGMTAGQVPAEAAENTPTDAAPIEAATPVESMQAPAEAITDTGQTGAPTEMTAVPDAGTGTAVASMAEAADSAGAADSPPLEAAPPPDAVQAGRAQLPPEDIGAAESAMQADQAAVDAVSTSPPPDTMQAAPEETAGIAVDAASTADAPPVSDIPPDAAPVPAENMADVSNGGVQGPVDVTPPDPVSPFPPEPPEPDTPAGGSAIGMALDDLSGQTPDKGGETGDAPSIVYNPIFNIESSGEVKKDVEEANRMGMREFDKMMQQWIKQNKRKAFA